jgi:8-oxo-dGTP pyrophosphatase MutT (NUDIX family)
LAATDATAASRTRLAGHFTGSAFLVSQDAQRTLLLRHAKLGRWLQPGGHADGEFDLARVALREAEEETGLAGLVVQSDIFDLDRHLIPARGTEPQHWHWDVRYVVRATHDETAEISCESEDAEWRDIALLAQDHAMDASLRRMALRFHEASQTKS